MNPTTKDLLYQLYDAITGSGGRQEEDDTVDIGDRHILRGYGVVVVTDIHMDLRDSVSPVQDASQVYFTTLGGAEESLTLGEFIQRFEGKP